MIFVLGGGANLNYKVVFGTSAPSSPKENTIWVNTSTAITGHAFSVTEPTNPVEGMVWFKTGDSSNVAFNVLKKNGAWVYPTSCRQRVSGEWTERNTKVFLNGSWIDIWNGIFNDAGQIFTPYAKQETNGTVAINTDGILFTTQKSEDSKSYMRYGPIRIDGIDSISADFKVIDTVSGSHYCYLFVGQTTGMTYADASIKAYTNPGKGESRTTTLDLSTAGLSGDYYVYVGTEAANWTYARSINNTKTYATR